MQIRHFPTSGFYLIGLLNIHDRSVSYKQHHSFVLLFILNVKMAEHLSTKLQYFESPILNYAN